VTAIIIEQYRKVMLNWNTIEDKYKQSLGFTMKGVCLDWVYLSFCCRISKQGSGGKKGGGKGKKK